MEERTERESDRRRNEKWQACWCCRDQQKTCRMAQTSAEKLEHTGPAEKERVASVPQRKRAVGKCARAAFAKWKRNRAVCPKHQIVRSAFRAEALKGKGGLHGERRPPWNLPRRKGRQARKASLGVVKKSMWSEWTQKLFRTICRVLVSLLVWPNLRWERRLGDEEPAHTMKE